MDVAQIPEAYFRRQLRLTGTVQRVRVLDRATHSENLVLNVVHRPILSSFRGSNERPLPVICATVKLEAQPDIQTLDEKVTALNQAWAGLKIQFRLLEPQTLDAVNAEDQTEAVLALIERRTGFFKRRQNLGVELVRLGHAVPSEYRLHLQRSASYERYYQELLQAEAVALKKNRGIWLNESAQPGIWSRFWASVLHRFSGKK